MLHRPEAEAVIAADTFVYAPYMLYDHVVNSLTRCTKHQPAIYIGDTVDSLIETAGGVHAKSRSKDVLDRESDQLRA